ncbi:MAG: DNA cytosine methyltransferase [Candidatus Omnitrophica bacterium]|nr:DNA cytosine methyltransferase [Candidatus Omnitrophota bacterium]
MLETMIAPQKVNGAKDAISRYVRLKQELDQDIFNNRWFVEDSLNVSLEDFCYNYVDLFSGAGGLSLGFTHANFEKIVSSEIDPDASATNKRHWPNAIHLEGPIENFSDGDIIKATKGQTIHVVCGGPPCNGFSVAGMRNPQDPRNLLFKQFVRVVNLIKPWFVLMENVPGILTMSGGQVKDTILQSFEKIDYPNMSVRILEAADYGVPQLRTRAIFVGNRFNFLNPYPKEIYSRANYRPIEGAIRDLIDVPRTSSINHEWTDHSKEFERRISKVLPGGSLYPSFRDAFKRQYLGVPSMTIKENHGGTHIHPILNRVISVREMARLQTFPDDFYFEGGMKRGMWQVGNAVPVLMAEHMARALRPSLDRIREKKTRKER